MNRAPTNYLYLDTNSLYGASVRDPPSTLCKKGARFIGSTAVASCRSDRGLGR